MSLFSFLKKNTEKVSLLVDIGNGSISCALIIKKTSRKPEFLYTDELSFKVTDEKDANKLVEEMSKLLSELLSKLVKSGFQNKYLKDNSRKIDSALITFSSPWFASRTKNIKLENEKPFIISKQFIEDIVKKEQENFLNEFGGPNKENFQIVENGIVHTKINGYSVENSIGKKTKKLDAYLHLSMVGKGVVNKVYSLILQNVHIPMENIRIHTFPLISFSIIRDFFSGSADFLIMDITGEVTDITLVQDDVIKQSVSIPSGKNFLLRQIAKTFGATAEIAESTLALFTQDKLDTESLRKMEEVLVNVEKEWSIYLENGLTELSPQLVLPGNIFLTADTEIISIYSNFLKISKTDSTAMFRKGLNIVQLDKTALSSFYICPETVKVSSFLALLALFHNKT